MMSTKELRFVVDEQFINELQKRIGVSSAADVAREALTILDWAAKERAAGRLVLSTSSTGEDVHRLVTPALEVAASSSSTNR
jgi:hypothetical protein